MENVNLLQKVMQILMTIDEEIKNAEELAELNEDQAQIYKEQGDTMGSLSYRECANEHRQLAEWLKELKALKDFAKFVAESVLSEDFEENSDFYAEVLCRKLTKLGKLKVVDNKYMEVNADEDDITNNNDMFIND